MPGLLHRLIAPKPSGTVRDNLAFTLPDGRNIEVLRVRDPRARRLKLSVDERGARLTLPMRASLVSGERFLHQHREWLAEQLSHHAGNGHGEGLIRHRTRTLPLRGQTLPLVWQEGRFARIGQIDGQLCFDAPARTSDAALRRTLRAWYEAEARADIGRQLPKYLSGLPLAPARFRLKMMSSQWGSLSPDGSLTLDLSLVLARPSAFEYVLVHELCHLIHANHSPAFWREVEARFPAWRDEREYFHAEGRRLKACLRALLEHRAPS